MEPRKLFYRRHLPHYQPPDSDYHVVFRLKGSLPARVIAELKREREGFERSLQRVRSGHERRAQYIACQQAYLERFDTQLAASVSGPFWLGDSAVASIVSDALAQRHGLDYTLHASTVMPNHVHMVFTTVGRDPAEEGPPERDANVLHAPITHIIGHLKGSTARQCNLALERNGPFWQDESYDHVIRTPDELERIIWYVLENPVKAGLVRSWEDWKWTYIKPGLIGRA